MSVKITDCIVVGLTAVLSLSALAGCSKSNSDPFQLKVGDCLPSADTTGLVKKVTTLPCNQAHTAEVYDSITVAKSTNFPGQTELERQAGACAASFKTFIGKPYDQSDLKITYFHPTAESWKQGDRQILCIVSVPTGTMKGTLKGSKR